MKRRTFMAGALALAPAAALGSMIPGAAVAEENPCRELWLEMSKAALDLEARVGPGHPWVPVPSMKRNDGGVMIAVPIGTTEIRYKPDPSDSFIKGYTMAWSGEALA